MRLLAIVFLFLAACGAKSSPKESVCARYPSAYEVLYDQATLPTVAKSEVDVCDNSFYKAKSEDGLHQITAESLTIRLFDQNGQPYLTEFKGQ